MAAITFTRSVFEHCKQPNGAYRARRTPYYNNLSLVVEAGHAYIIGNRGRKSITVKPSKKEPNRILVGLRGKYTVEVGYIAGYGRDGLEALEEFLDIPESARAWQENDTLQFLEQIVFRIAKSAEIDEPDIYV